MKLLLCGDSFTACEDIHSWAWYAKVANDLNASITNLSITGASNFNIWHQLDEGLKYNPDYVLVSLTAPNRIESLEGESGAVDYYRFLHGDIKSWAAHDRLAQREITLDYAEKFCDYNIAVSKDSIIVDSLIHKLENNNAVILTNLFKEYSNTSPSILSSAIPRDYCDVVTGELDEPQVGHLYKSMHEKFYNDHGHQIVSLFNMQTNK